MLWLLGDRMLNFQGFFMTILQCNHNSLLECYFYCPPFRDENTKAQKLVCGWVLAGEKALAEESGGLGSEFQSSQVDGCSGQRSPDRRGVSDACWQENMHHDHSRPLACSPRAFLPLTMTFRGPSDQTEGETQTRFLPSLVFSWQSTQGEKYPEGSGLSREGPHAGW